MKNKIIRNVIIVVFIFIIAVTSTILVANLLGKNDEFSKNSNEETSDFSENLGDEIADFGKNSDPEETDENQTSDENPPENLETLVETPTINSGNCSTSFGSLMLINPNFTVSTDFIAERKAQLVNITELYGIREGNANNGVPLLDPEAAINLNEMLTAYKESHKGHEITTRSCFRSEGTNCGRLCYATGTSDHHSGYTCDLVDDAYGGLLDTDYLESHPEWTWLHQNSYKYGFIDRFVSSWAGGSMSEPVNVDENGTTGLYETWHYRYVGKTAAEEIALGKYNNGNYDSLEHYLKASGRIRNLLNKESCN